jgi:membrane protease YdiL (CAAX protease family)
LVLITLPEAVAAALMPIKPGLAARWLNEVWRAEEASMARRHRAIVLYVVIAYGITWSIWFPYLMAAGSGSSQPNPFLYYLAAFGPLVAAVAAESYERGADGVRDLFARLIDARRAPGWVVIGLLSPLALVPLAVIAIAVAGAGWPTWSGIGISTRAPGLSPFMTWLLMTFSYGVGEEMGWRGFLLPRLQAKRSALAATLLLAVIWAGWHLPAFGFREGYVGLSVAGLVGFLVGLVAGAIVLTALYNASRGSILAVALWHGSWNWVSTSDGLQGAWVAVMTTVIIMAAPLLIWRFGARHLSPHARPVN